MKKIMLCQSNNSTKTPAKFEHGLSCTMVHKIIAFSTKRFNLQNFNWWRMLIRSTKNLNYKTRICWLVNQICQLQLFPLMRKKVPAATPSSPRDRPTPQNTAGPTPGTATSTSVGNIQTHDDAYVTECKCIHFNSKVTKLLFNNNIMIIKLFY